MSDIKSIEDGWKFYEDRTIPPGAPEIQRKLMRQSFYAGALFLMDMLMKSLDDMGEDHEKGVSYLNGLQKELLNEFGLQDIDRSNVQ
jgi:hypothetical protein